MHGHALPGFRDFYPDDAVLRNQIFAAWREAAARAGFVEYDGPPLEPLELYTAKSGAEIVDQLYTFEDKGGRAVALRPEMTPTLARMVAARAQGLKKPIRWFSIPQLFRYERQQRGRLREHFQLNVDLLGEAGPLADAEVIAVAVDVMRLLGLGPGDIRVRVSDRRVIAALLRDAGITDPQLPLVYGVIDKLEREEHDRLAGRLTGGGLSAEVAARALAVGGIRGEAALRAAVRDVPEAATAAEPLFECVEALGHMGLGAFVDVDLSIVRGLAYYTGIVFELFDTGRTLRAICGGGRYDDLLDALGGVDLPAVGFGMGDVVLGELLRERAAPGAEAASIDVFLVGVTAEDVPAVLALAHRLREGGVRAEFALKPQAIGKQLKLAAARGARRAIIIGPEERAAGEVVMRDLADGTESRIADERVTDETWWS